MSGYAYAALAGLQLAGGYFASQNIKQTAELNRSIAEMNAQFAELDMFDTLAQGETDKALYQKQIDDTLAAQSAMMNAQDIDMSFGSASSIEAETRFTGQLNLMQIEKEAQNRVLGIKRQTRDMIMGAEMKYGNDMSRASQAMFSGVMSAASTGLTGYERNGGAKYSGPVR